MNQLIDNNICLIIPSLSHGGAERVISILANEWSEKDNLEVNILLLTKQEKYYQIDNRVTIIEPEKGYSKNIWSKFLYKIWTLKYIRDNINIIKPTSILSFSEKYNNIVLLSLLFTKNKIFISDRNNPKKSLGKIHEFLRKKLYKRASGIIAQTDTAKQILFEKTKNVNITVIPNPLRELNNHNLKKENIILSIGRLVPQKNQKTLIEIFSKLSNTEDWKLKIIGTGPLENDLIKLIKELNLENKVELLGYKSDVDYYLQSSKIFAFTSLFEGFPNALSEAMGNGIASISFDCPTGPSELITNGENGILVDLNDVIEYTNKLQYLIDHNSYREEIGIKAQYVLDNFSKEKISERYLNFILK